MMNEKPVAIVTGAAGGLGREICRVLAEDGYRVALVDLDKAKLGALQDRLPASQAFVADITDERAVAQMVADVEQFFGRVDALVSNAGIEPAHTYRDMDTALFDRTIAVNVRAPALLIKHLVPALERRSSSAIVFIGSRTWLSGGAEPGYVASKAAAIGLARAAARELGPIGVTANVVSPSFVPTPLNRAKVEPTVVDQVTQHFAAMAPLKRLIEPTDVANTVAFLVSAKARNITGEVISVAAGSQLAPT